jgi:hypothetical protein
MKMKMKISTGLLALSGLLAGLGAKLALAQGENPDQVWPIHDNGLNKVVQWDHFSYYVNGQRLFVFSGEFHHWRYPV